MPVVFIMLDGLRPDALTQANTPHLDALMAGGAHTLQARSVIPPITLPCHMSIFHSVSPTVHGTQENAYKPLAHPYTSLVEHLKYHDLKSGLFYNWEFLRDLSRPGQAYFSYFIDTGYNLDGDAIIVETAAPYLARRAFDFTFVYLGTIDLCGHVFGWMSEQYIQHIEKVDGLVGALVEAMGDTTVIVHADHGGHGNDHGEDIAEDMTIPFIMAGAGVRSGYTIERAVSLLDTAPTVARALGVAPHNTWQGSAIEEAFVQTASA